MELNHKVEKILSREQKIKFQKDNGKFKILNNIVLLPIITSLIGIYLDSILIVSISIACIIVFLILKICSFSRKNIIYEDVIIPAILNEKFDKIEIIKGNNNVQEEFKKSGIIEKFDKLTVDKLYKINKDKYTISLSKIKIHKLNVEENDGVIDKDLEEKFFGAFAYVKLPTNYTTNFKVITKDPENSEENKVKIPYNEFDSLYDVYSLNPVESRNILSPGVMARIIEFNNKINNVFNFSIYEDMLYVAINYSNFLEFKGKGKKYINEIDAIKNLDLLETLDLFIRYFINIYEK